MYKLPLIILLLLGQFAQAQWITFTPSDKKFSVTLPATPKEDHSVAQKEGVEISIVEFECSGNEFDCGVAYSIYPSSVLDIETHDAVLDGGVNGAVQQVNGELIYQRKITIDGFPGREYKISVKKGNSNLVIVAKSCIVGRRVYFAQIVTLTSNEFSPNIRKFLDSFHVTR